MCSLNSDICSECGWELDEDDEFSCSNPKGCNAQVDAEEHMVRSAAPTSGRRPFKRGKRPTVITEAYIVDLIRRGRYKQFLRRERNSRR